MSAGPDLATLGIEIDTRQLDTADAKLDKFGNTAVATEAKTESFKGAAKLLNDTMLMVARAIEQNTAATNSLTRLQAEATATANSMAAAEEKVARSTYQTEIASVKLSVSYANLDRTQEQLVASTNAVVNAQGNANRAADELERRLYALQASVNPAAIAQAKLNAEIAEANALYKMGALSSSDYAKSISVLDSRMDMVVRGQNAINAAHGKGVDTSKALTMASLNLSRQFADIGVTAAMGMNPLMILIQQGPQVADAFQQAKLQGLGFTDTLKGVTGQATTAVRMLGPLIVVAGLVGGAFLMMHNEIRKSAGNLTEGMDLTKDQLKDLESTTITVGDTIQATFQVTGERIYEAFKGPIDNARDAFSEWYAQLVEDTKNEVATIIAFFSVGFKIATDIWNKFPDVISEGIINGVNLTISAVTQMINKVIAGINLLTGVAKTVAKAAGLDLAIGVIAPLEAGTVQNRFKGAGSNLAKSITEGWEGEKGNALKFMDGFYDDVLGRAKKNRLAKIMEELGDDKDKKTPKSQTERDYERAVKNAINATNALEGQAEAQRLLNDQVASGSIVMAEAQRAMELENKIRPIRIEAMKVEGEKRQVLLDLIERMTLAENKLTGEKIRAQNLGEVEAGSNRIETLRLELELVGKMNGEREIALAQLKAEQELQATGYDAATATPDQQAAAQARVESAKTEAGLIEELRIKTLAHNDALDKQLTILQQIDEQARSAADGMAQAFGKVGAALGDVMTIMTGYALKQEQLANDKAKYLLDGGKDATKLADYEKRAAAIQVQSYGDMASAAKGFFKEKSAGYKIMEGAERAFRLVEFAMSAQSIAVKAAETAAKLPLLASQAAAAAATGAANMFAALGPFGFAAVAAMGAVLAGFGLASMGGGGGGVPGVDDAENRQAAQGSGSVLGDAAAKSESLSRALEIVAKNSNTDLEYSNDMLKALKSIDNNIVVVASALARQLGAGGALDPSKLNLGTSGKPATLGNLGFGSTTNRSLQDQGLNFNTASLAEIIANGITGETYQQVLEQTKKKAFGITYSNKSKSSTTTGELDSEITADLTRLISSMREGVLSAATTLGVDGAKELLDSFNVNIGKISFEGMNGAEIQEALNGVFSKLGDEMAVAAMPFISELQKVGEGAFETLARVARQYQVLNTSLNSIGMTFEGVGVSSLAARERLIDLVGGLDEFVEKTQFFAENFLTQSEQMAPVIRAVNDEMARLGVGAVKSKDEFKALVLGLDVSTEAGAQMYAALMAVAPAFAKVSDYLSELTGTGEESVSVLERVKRAQSQLNDVWQKSRGELTQTITKFQGFSDNLKKFLQQLTTGPQAQLGPEAQYAASRKLFDQTSALAMSGDEKALGELQTVSQAYLDASKSYYASSKGYFDDLERVKEAVQASQSIAQRTADNAALQLAALDTQVKALLNIYDQAVSIEEAIRELNSALTAQAKEVETILNPPGTVANDNFDGAAYLQANADVMAAFNEYLSGQNTAKWEGAGYSSGMTADQFGDLHYGNGGNTEGRNTGQAEVVKNLQEVVTELQKANQQRAAIDAKQAEQQAAALEAAKAQTRATRAAGSKLP